MSTNVITYNQFSEICRLCMEFASEMNALHPLFLHHGNYGRYSAEFKESIPEMIDACVGIKVDSSDELPLNICIKCQDQLFSSNSFRHQCLQVSNRLQEIKLQYKYDGMDYDSEDNAPLHSLKPPELILVESIKDEEREVVDESYDNDDTAQDDPNDVYYEDKTTSESDYTSDDSYESIPKKKAKVKSEKSTPPIKQKAPAKTTKKSSTPSSSSTYEKPSTSKQVIKQEKRTNQTVYTPLAPVPPVLLQPVRASSTVTTASNLVIAQLQTPDQNNGAASADGASTTTATETQIKSEPKQRKKYEKLPKQCTVCGLIVRRLRDHMKGHPDALEFKCQHCNRKYLTQAGLERHMDTQHADRLMVQSTNGTSPNIKNKQSNEHLWIHNIRRRLRQMGLPYLDDKGRQIKGRTIGDSCPKTCHYECSLNFNKIERTRIHKHFWSLSSKEKTEFYLKFVQIIDTKRRTTHTNDSRRANTFQYFFSLPNDVRLQVCQRFFLQTIDISAKVIYRVVKKGYESKL